MKFEGSQEVREKETTPVFFVTGGDGMVGRRFQERVGKQGVIAAGRREFDLLMGEDHISRKIEDLQKEFGINTLINLGAITDVDFCELQSGDSEGAVWRTNALAPGYMARACGRLGIVYVQVSTDFVYEDRGIDPHRENDPLKPLSFYAKSKLQGEVLVKSATDKYHIARIQRPFTDDLETTRGGFPRDAYIANREGRVFKGIVDQMITPTYVNDCVDALMKISASIDYGEWNVSSPTVVTPYELVEMAFKNLEALGVEINWDLFGKVNFSDIPWKSPRPKNPAFSIAKFESHFGQGILRPIDEQVGDWAFNLVKNQTEGQVNA